LVDAIIRISHLVFSHPDIVEMDINPMIVSRMGAFATDAKITVRPSSRVDEPLRRLG
jgi:hypothetical protein